MKFIVITLFILIIGVIWYNMNIPRIITGGDYFHQTYKIKKPAKCDLRFKGDKNIIKKINKHSVDMNFRLRFITNILMNTISYKDGKRFIDNAISRAEKHNITTMDIVFVDPDHTIFNHIKANFPSVIEAYNLLWEDPENVPDEIYMKSLTFLQDYITLLDKNNILRKSINVALGINDYMSLDSPQSYHSQSAIEHGICGIRSLAPGMFETSSDDSIKNAYKIRRLIKSMSKDGSGGSRYDTINIMLKEMYINTISIQFFLRSDKSFGISITTNKNIIKDAPFYINNDSEVHVEPLFIDIEGKSTDAKELKRILNSNIDNIPEYIDNFHKYASENSLSMIYRKNLKELQRTFNVDVKNEKNILKKAYKLTTNRLR